jgi:RNA polymerase sigma factor (sigma-70 family)
MRAGVASKRQSDETDEALLAACLRGDAAAWSALIDRYAALIYSIPLKYRLSEADAADVFQSVCVTLLEKLDTVRAPRGLAAWIITTARRQSLAVARQRRLELLPTLTAEDLPDPDLLPEDELLSLERQRVIRAAVDQLPANCRRLIDGLFNDATEQATYRQLAEGLSVPMNSLGPTRARCFERLRRLLVAAGYLD